MLLLYSSSLGKFIKKYKYDLLVLHFLKSNWSIIMIEKKNTR